MRCNATLMAHRDRVVLVSFTPRHRGQGAGPDPVGAGVFLAGQVGLWTPGTQLFQPTATTRMRSSSTCRSGGGTGAGSASCGCCRHIRDIGKSGGGGSSIQNTQAGTVGLGFGGTMKYSAM